MKYNDYVYKTPKEIVKLLKNCARNDKLANLEQYYNGKHWNLESNIYGETRQTRSGKFAWKAFDDKPSRGFTAGELKIWNWIKLIVDIYTKYVRGVESDDIQIIVEQGDKNNDELSDEVNALFGDLNEWVMNATKHLAIYSVATTKYTMLEKGGANNTFDLLTTLAYEDNTKAGAMVEIINPKQIEPLYWDNDLIRGFIRFYVVDGNVARKEYASTKKGKELLYWEVWTINDEGKLTLTKYIEDELLPDTNPAPYSYIPYCLQVNEKRPEVNFDLDNIEDSDVDKNIDLQDDLNAFLTDLNTLYRSVAIPMLKASDDFIKSMKAGDMQKVKAEFSKINTALGTILFAPLERMDAPGTDSNQVVYLANMLDQFYRQTGIPKSVLNSEGIANIARETLDHLFQSLIVIIGHKRSQITKLIQRNVKLHLLQAGKWTPDMDVDVYYPDIFGLSKTDIAKLVIDGRNQTLLPKAYSVKKYIELMGDAENAEQILAELANEDGELKLELEALAAGQLDNVSPEDQATIDQNIGQRNSNAGELMMNEGEKAGITADNKMA